jgi:UDP-2,3-diacylglucosamine pyrophosphatase LpxH
MQTWKLMRRIKGERTHGFVKHIERRILSWVESCQQAIICGHTHRARIPDYGGLPYFNTGSFIVPGVATGLELQGGKISLVRWTAHPVTHVVRRELVASPRKLRLFSY